MFRSRYFLELARSYGFIPHSLKQLSLHGRAEIRKRNAMPKPPQVEEITLNTARVFAEQFNPGCQILLPVKNVHGINFKCSENVSAITRPFSEQQLFRKHCFPEAVWGTVQAPELDDLLPRLQSLKRADRSMLPASRKRVVGFSQYRYKTGGGQDTIELQVGMVGNGTPKFQGCAFYPKLACGRRRQEGCLGRLLSATQTETWVSWYFSGIQMS